VIRVVYRWRIEPGAREEFTSWWHDGTVRIRSTFPGAMGSTLLAPADDPDHMVAIARWRSRHDLEAFWADPGGTPFAGAVMEGADIFDEVDDLTVSDG